MHKHVLKNGLRVVMEQIPACRSVAIGIWVKTGSRHEHLDTNGISHFIEHMLFKGTKRYSAKQIAEVFDGIGGDVNAFTSREYTCYYAKVLDEHLPMAIEVLSEMYLHSRIDPDEMKKECNVIIEEISMYEDTPDDLVHDLAIQAAYGEHALAYSILGPQSNLRRLTNVQLREYMQAHYNIENTVISLAGNLNEQVLELLEQHFGGFTNHGKQSRETAPVYIGNSVYQAKKTEQNHVCLSLPGLSMKDADVYAMILLNNVIGGSMSSRLFQEVREERGLAYSVYSYHSSHLDSGLFTIYAGMAPEQTSEVFKVMMEVLANIRDQGITEQEWIKGKEHLKGSLILGLESVSSRMNRLGKNELMLGVHYSLDELIHKIEQIQLQQIDNVIKQMFAHPFAIAMVGQGQQKLDEFRRDQLVLPRSY